MQIEAFQNREQELKKQLQIIRDEFTEQKHDAQREIARMYEDRKVLYQQIRMSNTKYQN